MITTKKIIALIGLFVLAHSVSFANSDHEMAGGDDGSPMMAGKMNESDLPKGGVSFASPKAGTKISADQAKKIPVKFLVEGMDVVPAGIVKKHSGHHHLIIDGKFVPFGHVVPTDKMHIHFGKGQKETEITLKPGKHTLTLQFADAMHRSYGKKFSKTITVTVE